MRVSSYSIGPCALLAEPYAEPTPPRARPAVLRPPRWAPSSRQSSTGRRVRSPPERAARKVDRRSPRLLLISAFEPHSNAALPVAFAPTTEPHLGEESVRLPRAAGSVERLDDSRQEIEADAHLLADHGPAGGHWLGAAPYAWRVLRRQRELRRALQGRRQEAVRARGEQEDALVAFADRLRPVAAGLPDYIEAMD